jgi:predicted AAA+ superfamily ATPase
LASGAVYLDLENPFDMKKLDNSQLFLEAAKNKLVCIDEVQRKPELFQLLRVLVDQWDRPGCFLILGSASRDLLKQSSETLAGRISYKTLHPFIMDEIAGAEPTISLETYIERGGFPRSLLNIDSEDSYHWREDFITTFLERDLLDWKGFTPQTMNRLWHMLAHNNGQTVNYSILASSLGVSALTVRNYIDLLASTFMLEVVPPYLSNLGKRLVKAPKVYVADSGICMALLGIKTFLDAVGHPVFGALWESVVLAHIKGWFPDAEVYFYRSGGGAEIDFVVELENKVYAVECKASYTPTLSKGNFFALEDIKPERTFVVIPANEGWPMRQNMDVVTLEGLCDGLGGGK